MPLRDTTPEAQRLQVAIHQRLSPSERFASAIEMSNFAHELAAATLKRREPGCPDEEVMRRLASVLYSRASGRR